jgi:spore coat protein CotH
MAAEQIASAQNSNATPAKSTEAGLGDFYRGDEVQSIYLRVAEEDMQRMRAALPERIYVRASFRWRDISVENVAIRFKGNSSSAPSQQHKRSFLIKFDEYADGQRFLGLRRVSLDNGVQFGSVFSEPIITEILRDQGIKTHRCNYAKLFLNDKYHGVYVNVERIDESFIERHLPDPNGLLFKVDEGGPGANLQFLGDDRSAYARAFEPETKSAKKGQGQRRLVEFIRMINQSPEKDFAAKLDAKMEVDDFLRVTAVLLFSGAFDQLTGWQPHNYYLYCDGKQDRWRYLPWDLDVGFCEIAFGKIHVLADWNAAWPVAGQLPNPLLERIVADPALLQRYRDTARIILDKYFEPERLCAIIDAKYALIKADLAADPFPHRRVTNPEDQSYEDIVASMKKFVRNRYTSARQQLANPGKRPEMVRRPDGPPPQLVEQIQRLQRAAEQMQRNRKDMLPIQKLMQQVGPLLQQGRMEEAEKLIGEALKLAGEDPGKGKEESPRDKRKARPSPDSSF